MDGDEIRSNVDYKYDFSIQGIKQNSLDIIELCKENIDLYDYIIVSVIAPFEETIKYARQILCDNYIEIFVKASLNKLITRDTKGLYKKALNGKLDNLIGFDPNTPYQIPLNPDFIVDTDVETGDQSFKKLLNFVMNRNI